MALTLLIINEIVRGLLGLYNTCSWY